MNDIEKLKELVVKFRDERNWKQFHNPKNLSLALSVEVSELAENFLWVDNKDSKKTAYEKIDNVKEEMADIFIYLLSLADVLDINLKDAVINKIDKNKEKYPIDKSYGSCKKYTELN